MKIICFHIETFLILYLMALGICFIVWKLKTHKKFTFLYCTLFILYMLILIKTVFTPIFIYEGDSFIRMTTIHKDIYKLTNFIQLVPFKTILNGFKENTWIMQIVGNIILFVPMGCFFTAIQIRNNFNNSKLLACGLLTSFLIELIQLIINIIIIIPYRVSDIDDIMMNMIGYIIGTFITKILLKNKHILNLFRNLVYYKNIDEEN